MPVYIWIWILFCCNGVEIVYIGNQISLMLSTLHILQGAFSVFYVFFTEELQAAMWLWLGDGQIILLVSSLLKLIQKYKN